MTPAARCSCGGHDWPRAIGDHARRQPQRTAVVWTGGRLTYGQLVTLSGALAHHLRDVTPSRPARIGVCLDRSWRAVVAVLGILEAECIYVPLDASHPLERLQAVIEDAQLDALLVERPTASLIPDSARPIACVIDDLLAPAPAAGSGTEPAVCRCRELAYIMYTSGTTGTPKGVMIERRNLAACLAASQERFEWRRSDKLAAVAPWAFDISLFEILNPLVAGGSVWIVGKVEILNARALTDVLARCTMFHAVPALMQGLVGHLRNTTTSLPSLATVFVGGDRVPPDLLASLRDVFPHAQVHVLYGPTEATIISTSHRVSADLRADAIIGSALPGSIVKVVPLEPSGTSGEIWIGGEGVGRGYWRRDDLTQAQFVKRDGDRYYRTGDLARVQPDGNLVFLGRLDRQVKIRGQRIEPAEIEIALRRHPGVLDAAVAPRVNSNGDTTLAAWVVPVAGDSRTHMWPSVGEYPLYDELIYRGLTSDEERNRAYLHALTCTAPGRVVVDVGTGADAILARMAAQAGARRVYAIEAREDAFRAAVACVANAGMSDRIQVIKGDARQVALPEQPEVCVSEIFESIGGAEGAGMILSAVRRQLCGARVMVPWQVTTMVAAVSIPDSSRKAPRFDPVAAYYVEKAFAAFGRPFDIRLCVRGASREWLLSGEDVFERLDLDDPGTTRSDRRAHLRIQRKGTVDGFLLWLRLTMPDGRVLDTLDTATSWFPAFVPAFDGAAVEPGDELIADCVSRLSADGVHPDYALRGTLTRPGRRHLGFDCDLAYRPQHFRRDLFYQQLFHDSGVPARGLTIDASEIRRHAASLLPAHMIPSTVTLVERLPLTPNGKLDYAALPEPTVARSPALSGYAPPTDERERRMVGIWEQVLDASPIGVRDSFFDLGGDSLTALRLIERVRHELDVDIPLASLYRDQTVERLVQSLAGRPPDRADRARARLARLTPCDVHL
ncbi:MAG: amino acid adenylation domain-containing protein [Vicinamibacterales bacterium]